MAHKLVVEFSPGSVPLSTTRSWVDVTERVEFCEWEIGRQRDLTEWPPGEATIVLRNDDHREFDPDNTSSTYNGQLLPRVPFRIMSLPTVLDAPGVSGAGASTSDT
ncbi:MAG: hypothetical protein GWN07_09675, partial [Actinobacteria bacterium]|nr:hypothetical protein [Actinomycetota bacterium]NIS30545.1 hypothetical protein [Actinomycetota bacterium]NIU65755.1 hypothetical protein [Actinomycetota bacterium]NIW27566.1 hypothetical protein [Actinomycetota bacterium]NIX20080.1 hypothetical protein [Actinomycetota bacterium]